MTSTTETTDKPKRILVGDDDEAFREIMTSILTAAGYACRVAKALAETLKILESGEQFDLVLCGTAECAETDFDGIIRKTAPYDTPVVVLIGVVDLVSRVQQMGAYDFLLKPLQHGQLTFVVRRALEHRRLKRENLFLRDRLGLGSGIEIPSP